MSVKIISADALRASLSFEDLIEPVSLAFQYSSEGKAGNGQINMFPHPDRTRGDVLVKTGTLDGAPIYMVKVSPWFATNIEENKPQGGFVAVFDATNGQTLALLNDQHYLSDIRTAAAGALAARMLAPLDVGTATVIGAGIQAYWQALALYHERRFARLSIWARDAAKAALLTDRLAPRLPHVDIQVEPSLQRAVQFGDVVITATQSREPLVRGDWLRAGQHITAVGADDATKCELDAAALRRSRVFVDTIGTALANGEVHRAVKSGDYVREELAGEIGDVLANRCIGRQSADDITVATFAGIGAQDVVAANVALRSLI